MPQGARAQRVGEEFREILAVEVQKLKDPRAGFITITGVIVSADLHVAWVAYSVYGDEKEQVASAAALRSAAPHLRRALGRQIHLKVTPELRFERDDTYRRGERIDAIIDTIHHGEAADDG
jgi:ribosome-binding factor A